MSYPRFEIKKSSSATQPFYFVLRAMNAEPILTSETYTTKQGCTNGITSVKRHAPDNRNYDKRSSTKDEPYFVLKAGNGEVIGISEMYSSTAARDNGINAVKRDAPVAPIDDQAR